MRLLFAESRAVKVAIIAAALTIAAPSLTVAFSDDDARNAIIEQSRDAYHATGHPCACPYDRARNGTMCGARSAYSRPGGASPKCYPTDVSAAELTFFRLHH